MKTLNINSLVLAANCDFSIYTGVSSVHVVLHSDTGALYCAGANKYDGSVIATYKNEKPAEIKFITQDKLDELTGKKPTVPVAGTGSDGYSRSVFDR